MSGRDIKSRDEQAKDCQSYVERGGGVYVHTYTEPDTSAYKRRRVTLPDGRRGYRVVRPVYEEALNDLKRGQRPDGTPLDGLVVYDIDRLTRDNRDLEDAIEVVAHFGRPILDWTGTLDLLTDNGRTVARIVVATANKASADTARRVARKHRALEQAGIPTGGSRPFGWRADKRTLDPVEAPELCRAADRLLAGAPISSIPADWNRRGITTPAGKKWTTTNVRTLFRNPRICGYRARTVHQIRPDRDSETRWKEIVRNGDGDPVTGLWEPVLTPAEWETITGLLAAGGTRPPGHNARKFLLTGTMRCGKTRTARQTTAGTTVGSRRPGRGPGAIGYRQVADSLREQITAGALPPAAAIPSEAQLMAAYGSPGPPCGPRSPRWSPKGWWSRCTARARSSAGPTTARPSPTPARSP